MKITKTRVGVLCLVPLLALSVAANHRAEPEANAAAEDRSIQVHYLEIVTPSVEETCMALAETHGVEFSDPIMSFGNARTADLKGGGRIGVRGPMRSTESPVVRPYLLVDDIKAAVEAAKVAGAEIAMPPMAMPGGQGTFSIYILGGIEHGLWQQ